MTPSAKRAVFLAFSAELTGYGETELEGTGNVDTYQALVEQQAGPIICDMFYAAAEGVVQASGAASESARAAFRSRKRRIGQRGA